MRLFKRWPKSLFSKAGRKAIKALRNYLISYRVAIQEVNKDCLYAKALFEALQIITAKYPGELFLKADRPPCLSPSASTI